MGKSLSIRIGAASGAIGAVMLVVSGFTAGTPLKPDASLPTVITYLSTRRGSLLAGYLIAVIGVGLILWFLGYLRAFLAEIEGGGAPLASITLASWVALFGILVAGSVPLVAVVWRGAAVDPLAARVAFDASNLSLNALSAPAAILSVLAPIVVIWRSRALSRWLVGLGVIEIAVSVIALFGLFSRTGGNTGGYFWGVGELLGAVWIAALSVAIFVKKSTTTTTT